MVKVVIADNIYRSGVEMLSQQGMQVVDVSSNKDKLLSELKSADAVIIRGATKVTQDFLLQAPMLKFVGRAGVGLDNVDLPACESKGIKVMNSPEGPTRSVVELTLGLMIASARRFNEVNSGTKAGQWPKKFKGIELYHKTLGIVGTGAIGGLLAKYCISLGMKILAYDIVRLPALERIEGFTYVELEDLLPNSDFISIHVPLLPDTKHMINKSSFEQMKDGVIVLNCARGGIIDENALLAALNNNKVAAAALDVYEQEPVDHTKELFQHSRVITTPHIGSQTTDASKNNTTEICEKLIEFFSSDITG